MPAARDAHRRRLRRRQDHFPAVDFFERRQIPFIIAVNCFDGAQLYTVQEVRAAIDLEVPIVLCDVRNRESARTCSSHSPSTCCPRPPADPPGTRAWDPTLADDEVWARPHEHFTELEIVELGYFIGLTTGQQKFLKALGIKHGELGLESAAGLAPDVAERLLGTPAS